MTTPNIVSGAVSTVSDLGKDEAWMRDWLKDQPTRLGLGELDVAEGASEDDGSFVATDEERCFSVEVKLGEMEASHGFQLLDNWARNRVLHPDKTHVAVLVTETAGERYRTTLETLAEHLPLVVVELQVWKGDTEAIVVPHIGLSSDDVDLSSTPAAKAAEVVAKTETVTDPEDAAGDEVDEPEVEAMADDEVESEAEAEARTDDDADAPEDKDDTGVADPWGLPRADPEEAEAEAEASDNGHRLLSKIG